MDSHAHSEAHRRSCTTSLDRFGPVLLIAASAMAGACNVDKLVSSDGGESRAGVAAKLVFTQTPSSVAVGASITPAPEVTVRDGFGDVVTTFNGEITLELAQNPGNGTLSGTTTRSAVSGVARFPQLSINRPGEGYRLRAAAPNLERATTPGFNVVVRPGLRLVISSGNEQTDTVGARLPRPYVVRVLNSIGDPVAGATVRWSVSPGAGSVSPTTSVTNAEGLASTVHTLGTVASEQSVTATVSDLLGLPATFTSTASPGAVARIVFTQQPTDTEENEDISPPVTITLRDRFGNRVTNYSGTVQISITPGTGHPQAKLSGKRSQNASSGVATFSNLRIDREEDDYRLRAQAGNLFADSSPFDIED